MKEIPFATKYLVSEDGQVFSKKPDGTTVPKKSQVDTSRYHRISLINDDGKNKKYLVHRLVAITYIPNPDEKPEVNHIDGDKMNNCVSNLEWVTRSENLKHAFSIDLKSCVGENNPRCELTEQEVLEIYKCLLEGQLEKDLAVRFKTKKEIVKKIKYKATWKHILSDFPDIPVKMKHKSISDSTAHWVCERLQEGKTVQEILKLSTNERISFDIVNDIRRRRTFRHVSENYKW